MHKTFLLLLLSVLSGGLSAASAASAIVPAYHLLKAVPLPGEGGWDYLSVDDSAHRLYVTHGAQIVVIDTLSDTVVGNITGLSGVHGFALAPRQSRGFASNGRANTVTTVDLVSLKATATTPTGQNPDAILFEPTKSEVYAFNGRSQSVTILSAATGQVVATVPLGGKPEFVQTQDGRVFVDLEDKNQLVVIDASSHAVTHRWEVAPGDEPSALELDRAHHRLFIGCGNEKIVVLDSRDGKRVADLPAGKGIDAVAFDPGTQLILAANGSDGTVTIAHEATPDSYTVVQTLATERSARTLALELSSHKIYLVSARFAEKKPGEKRAAMVPGSLKLLVYGLN